MSGVHEAIRESCAKEMGIVISIEAYAIVVQVPVAVRTQISL
jgi:hypothetical protein